MVWIKDASSKSSIGQGAGTCYWLWEAHTQPYAEKAKPVVIAVPITGHDVAASRVEVAKNDQVIQFSVEIFFHVSSESRIGA